MHVYRQALTARGAASPPSLARAEQLSSAGRSHGGRTRMPRLPNSCQQEEGGIRRRRTLVTRTRTLRALLTPPTRKFPNESAVRNKWDETLRGPARNWTAHAQRAAGFEAVKLRI